MLNSQVLNLKRCIHAIVCYIYICTGCAFSPHVDASGIDVEHGVPGHFENAAQFVIIFLAVVGIVIEVRLGHFVLRVSVPSHWLR